MVLTESGDTDVSISPNRSGLLPDDFGRPGLRHYGVVFNAAV